MNTKTFKVSELQGAALDWAVAKCEGMKNLRHNPHRFDNRLIMDSTMGNVVFLDDLQYSTDWGQGGEIIQREKITVVCAEGDYNPEKSGTPDCYDTYWVADKGRLTASTVYGSQGDDFGTVFQVDHESISGSTPLIAAMRCFVAAKLGLEVEVPDEFLK